MGKFTVLGKQGYSKANSPVSDSQTLVKEGLIERQPTTQYDKTPKRWK